MFVADILNELLPACIVDVLLQRAIIAVKMRFVPRVVHFELRRDAIAEIRKVGLFTELKPVHEDDIDIRNGNEVRPAVIEQAELVVRQVVLAGNILRNALVNVVEQLLRLYSMPMTAAVLAVTLRPVCVDQLLERNRCYAINANHR
ncbi:hypothetical protein N5938_02960 [Pseudomonas aeruginosa]|uniref:hypothetical protein n=1 Tax=Pseudomonas aeruginosa TaxID=287 RepID=UPI0021F249C8|nr:hypothetical protein [Pseudomonas aeruginosa]UYM61911.1 hypothetical protein N5938_02960 [Pseudomonas aeruginosa]